MRDSICLRVFELSLDRDRDVVENTSLKYMSDEEMEIASMATNMSHTRKDRTVQRHEVENEAGETTNSANTTLEGSIPDDILTELITSQDLNKTQTTDELDDTVEDEI